MTRENRWKAACLVSSSLAILFGLLLLPACCCVRGPASRADAELPVRTPPIGSEPIPTPTEAAAKAPTQTEMHNVRFHFDPDLVLEIHALRGEMLSKEAGTPLNFDNKRSFVMRVDKARIGLRGASLDRLMNHYVFAGPNMPLRNLHITMSDRQLKQEGIIHKLVDIPFVMWADVSASGGLIRLHPTKVSICGINGLGLLAAVGMTLEKMLDLPRGRGVSAKKNDLLLDPARLLPPPEVELHLSSVAVEGDELVQTFDAGRDLAPLVIPVPSEKNTMYFRGGTLRMGKLLMVDADMQVVDSDPSDWFDFFIDRYNDQLIEGFTRNRPDYGLLVAMRDFEDVGLPLRPGERSAAAPKQ